MSWFTDIVSGGFSNVIDSVGKVINGLFTTDDEREKNKIALTQISLAAQQAENEMKERLEKAYLDDAKDLRRQITTEIQSQDAYVRRARPTFNYIFYIIIVINYIFIPIYQMFTGNPLKPIDLPTEMWTVFGVGFIGYGYLRTVEKTGKKLPVPHKD